jgi:hypothetical protein
MNDQDRIRLCESESCTKCGKPRWLTMSHFDFICSDPKCDYKEAVVDYLYKHFVFAKKDTSKDTSAIDFSSDKNQFPVEKYVDTMIMGDYLEADQSYDEMFFVYLQTLDGTEPLIVDKGYIDKEHVYESLPLVRKSFADSLKAILKEYDQWKETKSK